MRNFRDLAVWEKSHKLVLDVYRASRSFPTDERFALTSQLRRAVSSIPTNVAEGCGRDGERELARFVSIASGSAVETEYLLLLSRDLSYLSGADHDVLHERVTEVKRMLTAFHQRLTTGPGSRLTADR